jgi:hypothetical protein
LRWGKDDDSLFGFVPLIVHNQEGVNSLRLIARRLPINATSGVLRMYEASLWKAIKYMAHTSLQFADWHKS